MNDTRFETFSTYKIFTLELISIFCSIRKNRVKNEAGKSETNSETGAVSASAMDINEQTPISNKILSRDNNVITASQELKIINIILKSIKTADLDVYHIQSIIESSDIDLFLKNLNDRIECLSKNTVLELRNLINDLKIYFIGPNVNDSIIKPWSVVGKYVRRCIIIYEKMAFDKLVELCKESSIQLKNLSILIARNRQNNFCNNKNSQLNNQQNNIEIAIYSDNQNENLPNEPDNSNSPMSCALFLNDESNLTITSEFFNRSTNADCSVMDLEPLLDESITHANTTQNNNSLNISSNRGEFSSKFNVPNHVLYQKALTSTVSAQRTQSLSNFKSLKTGQSSKQTDNSESKAKSSAGTSAGAGSSSNQPRSVTFKDCKKDETKPAASTSLLMTNDNYNQKSDSKLNDKTAAGLFSVFNLGQSSLTNGFSRKMAEFFIAQQANLIENNEHDALRPIELQQKLDELIAYDPNFSDAYYLKYLNYLRLKDYASALKSLHDYFDRTLLAGSVSLAALNLCSLEYRFNHKENALYALKEAITSAHQEGDITCLQHCLSWLYKIEPFNVNNMSWKNFLIKSACSRAINNELYSLASYNLHYFARSNVGRQQPHLILNLLNKTDIVNLKMNSKTELILLSQCHKASLWNLYGQRKLSNLHSQILLNLLPKTISTKLNTESQCIAMCYLALDYSRNGMYNTSQNIINLCKELYSVNLKISEHWLFTENIILIDKCTLSGKWGLSKVHIEKLASINIQQALLQEMNIFVLENNIERAKDIGNKILSNMNLGFIESSQINNYSNNFNGISEGRNSFSKSNNIYLTNMDKNSHFDIWNEQISIQLRLNYIQIYLLLHEYSNALIAAVKFNQEIKQLDFNYEYMVSCMLIAKILIHMEHPDQAIKYLEKCIIFILSNGALVDQAKLHYLYAKCVHLLDKKQRINVAINHMYKCVEKLESVQANIYLISAYSYLSFLLNETGNIAERNKYSFKFKQLRQQLPLVGYLL